MQIDEDTSALVYTIIGMHEKGLPLDKIRTKVRGILSTLYSSHYEKEERCTFWDDYDEDDLPWEVDKIDELKSDSGE